MLTKKLVRHGNSLALVIDKPILDLLGIDELTDINIITDGMGLLIQPARPGRKKKDLSSALEEVNRKYGNTLRRLAH